MYAIDCWLDVTYAAIQVLLSRVDRTKTPPIEEEYTMDLVTDLATAAMKCSGTCQFALLLSLADIFLRSIHRSAKQPTYDIP